MHTSAMGTDDNRDYGVGLSDLGGSENPAEVTQRYDEWVDAYEGDVRDWGYDVPEVLASKLGPTGGSVLDAGCGTGLCGRAVRAMSPDVELTGIDASPESVAKAASTGVYATTAVVDLNGALPYGDGEFDAVICGGVLTYIDDPEPVLREFVRVTRTGGRAIVTQRTDKWVEHDCDAVVESLRASGICQVDVDEPRPYLPGLDEYGDTIKVIYMTLTAT